MFIDWGGKERTSAEDLSKLVDIVVLLSYIHLIPTSVFLLLAHTPTPWTCIVLNQNTDNSINQPTPVPPQSKEYLLRSFLIFNKY